MRDRSASPNPLRGLVPMPLRELTTLQTPRAIIRPVSERDLADLMDVNGDPEVTRHLPYSTWTTEQDAHAWLQRMNQQVDSGSARQLVIQSRDTGKAIGTILLFRYEESSQRLDLGYALGRAYWRRGIARETVGAVIDNVVSVFGIRRVEAEVNLDNTSSQGLLDRLGFLREGLLRERWIDKGSPCSVFMYGLLGREWNARKFNA